MDRITVDNIQALLILTYIELVDNHIEKAISLIGIVSQHIDYVQLAHERATTELPKHTPTRESNSMTSSEWIHEEEERRVFWTAIMLDRLCAIITRCRSRITAPNIRRRLPVCASYWFTNRVFQTPFIRVLDATGVTTMHQPNSFPRSTSQSMGSSPSVYDGDPLPSSGIGALAFFVETVESMSMVMVFSSHLSIDFDDREAVSRWLVRFKEIDDYLIW